MKGRQALMWDNQSPEMQSKPIPPFASFKNWSYSEFSCEALEQWLTVPITGYSFSTTTICFKEFCQSRCRQMERNHILFGFCEI